ncbi:MAG: hypothetical protein LBU36_08085 [Clostridiales bacterium]|jgi:hypothetical protein|nr:hypothetical protein [Clostridiales bacterium]
MTGSRKLKMYEKIVVAVIILAAVGYCYGRWVIKPMQVKIAEKSGELERLQKEYEQQEANVAKVPVLIKERERLEDVASRAQVKFTPIRSTQFYYDTLIKLAADSGVATKSLGVSAVSYRDMNSPKSIDSFVAGDANPLNDAIRNYRNAPDDAISVAQAYTMGDEIKPSNALLSDDQRKAIDRKIADEEKARNASPDERKPADDLPVSEHRDDIKNILEEANLPTSSEGMSVRMKTVPVEFEVNSQSFQTFQSFITALKGLGYTMKFDNVTFTPGTGAKMSFWFASVDYIMPYDDTVKYQTIGPANSLDVFVAKK